MKFGEKFGGWTVINEEPIKDKIQGLFYKCRCMCGTEKYVRAAYLKNGKSKYCSCRGKLDKSKNEKRFNESYKVNELTGCWEWKMNFTRGGYGSFFYMGKIQRAHRVSYFLHKGEIRDGFVVCHKCDNPKCVNPDHLFVGTYSDNNKDKVLKGRHAKSNPKIAGILNKISKLTDDDVVKIRNLASSGISKAEIGRIFNIRDSHVCKIVSRQSWRHVP